MCKQKQRLECVATAKGHLEPPGHVVMVLAEIQNLPGPQRRTGIPLTKQSLPREGQTVTGQRPRDKQRGEESGTSV